MEVSFQRREFLPCDPATIYRCRWEVELLFRELKTRYELDEFDTTKKHIVEILVYAALLSLITSRTLLNLATAAVRADGRRRSENLPGTTDPPRATRYCHATGGDVLAKNGYD